MKSYLQYLKSIQDPKTFSRKVAYINYNFKSFIPLPKESKILEIGPGLGEFIYLLNKNKYFQIDIVDNDKDIRDYISKKFKIVNAYQPKELAITKKYDLIFLLQVFEHIPKKKYREYLNFLYNHLNKKGKIILTVPNGGNPLSTVERYSDLTHESIFTENSLRELPNYADLSNCKIKIQPYKIPPTNIINIIRIFFQKILHLLLKLVLIINGGVYTQIYTPNITAIITKK